LKEGPLFLLRTVDKLDAYRNATSASAAYGNTGSEFGRENSGSKFEMFFSLQITGANGIGSSGGACAEKDD
jgi:hypothetical protein